MISMSDCTDRTAGTGIIDLRKNHHSRGFSLAISHAIAWPLAVVPESRRD